MVETSLPNTFKNFLYLMSKYTIKNKNVKEIQGKIFIFIRLDIRKWKKVSKKYDDFIEIYYSSNIMPISN